MTLNFLTRARWAAVAVALIAGSTAASAFKVYLRASDECYNSSEIKQITLNADRSATVTLTSGSAVQIPASEFKGIAFTTPAGVEEIDADSSEWLTLSGGYINVPGAAGISLLDIDGRLCARSEGPALYVGDLKPGVYIVSTSKKSTKILLR